MSATGERLEEFKRFCEGHAGMEFLDACFSDLTGNIRGKRLPLPVASKAFGDGVSIPYSIYFLNVRGGCDDPCAMGESDGDPDGVGVPVDGTLVPVPWTRERGCQVMMRLLDERGEPSWTDPRTVAENALRRWHDRGLNPVVAFELEFYLLDAASVDAGRPQPASLVPGGPPESGTNVYDFVSLDERSDFFRDVREACAAQGIPATVVTSEFAPGQYEINLEHSAAPLTGADHCVMFRRLVRGVAAAHGMYASFMAKPFVDQTGSGLHLHMSAIDEQGVNVFDAERNESAGQQLRSAIGGLLETMPGALSFVTPNVNSFRRFSPDSFVPMNRSWGYNNRAVTCRIPAGPSAATRIEYRVAGADANPYLALAVMLAGTHHGTEHGIDPGAEAGDNAGATADPEIPPDFLRALERSRADVHMNEYFGDDFVALYTETKRLEYQEFSKNISEHEHRWYL